jgi:hypothetical protein
MTFHDSMTWKVHLEQNNFIQINETTVTQIPEQQQQQYEPETPLYEDSYQRNEYIPQQSRRASHSSQLPQVYGLNTYKTSAQRSNDYYNPAARGMKTSFDLGELALHPPEPTYASHFQNSYATNFSNLSTITNSEF